MTEITILHTSVEFVVLICPIFVVSNNCSIVITHRPISQKGEMASSYQPITFLCKIWKLQSGTTVAQIRSHD